MQEKTASGQVPTQTRTRKIGNCTFVVSSSVKEGKQRDMASTLVRLIQSDLNKKQGA
jgi:hypothetical protein